MGPSGCMGSGLGGGETWGETHILRGCLLPIGRYRVPSCVGFPRASRMAYSDRIGWSRVRVDTNV